MGGIEAARSARGTVVVIDVIRAFTVSACALAGGARECRLVRHLAEARRLAASLPAAVVSAEVDGLPVPGIPISNSPTMVSAAALAGRVMIQRTSAGTQAMAAVRGADHLFGAALVVAAATARALGRLAPDRVTFVASGPDDPEDSACAHYIEGLVRGSAPDLAELLAPLFASERYAELAGGRRPGFPATDLGHALDADRFDFAMAAAPAQPGVSLHRSG